MSKIKVSEIFYSIQGEGLYVGQPSVFVRTFGCNFRCKRFGVPDYERTPNEVEAIIEQRKEHPEWRYEDLPLVKTGCDSYAAVYPAFKDLSPSLGIDQIVTEIYNTHYSSHASKKDTHIVITGGEPLLGWQKNYPVLLDRLGEWGYKYITFETNGTQTLTDAFTDYLMLNHISGKQLNFTFSVSPKLPSASGEEFSKALKPDVVASYESFGTTYLKFVVSEQSDMVEVLEFVSAYRNAGFTGEVYLMPLGGTVETYNLTAPEVAKLAMDYGYRYSPRLQVDLFGNQWMT